MEWEDTKENFVPVKHGRSAVTLLTPLSVSKRNPEIDEARRSFLDTIKAAEDPLPAWLKYIKWTQEQYATQGTKAELQQVLEAATKSLSSTNRYNNDVRMLRVWIQYADCLPDPSDVFLYLAERDIGRDHALLYEAYATYLELKGNFSQAELVFQDGINRLAKPLERLKQKQAAFQQRMAKRIQRQTNEAALGMDTTAGAEAGSMARATLASVDAPQLDENGQLLRATRQQQQQQQRRPVQAFSAAAGVRAATTTSSSSGQPAGLWGGRGSSAAAPVQPAGGVFGMGSSSSGPHLPPPLQGAANGAKLFEVAVDDEFGPSASGPVPTAFPAAIAAGQRSSSQLPAYVAARKENTSKPGEWAGMKLKQREVFTAPVAPKLEICEDDDLPEPDRQPLQQEPPQQAGRIRQQLEAKPTASRAGASVAAAAAAEFGSLRLQSAHPSTGLHGSQPQQHQAKLAQPPCNTTKANSSRQAHHSNRPASSAGSAAVPAAAAGPRGYNEALLVGPDAVELSFEEIRAASWRAKHLQQRKELEQQQQQEQQRVQQQQLEQAQQQKQQQGRQKAQQRLQEQAQQQQQQRHQHEKQALRVQSRAVLVVRADESDSDSQPAMPHSSQHQQQQSGVASRQQQKQQPYTAAEPTVTMNTRAAFEAMNGMFCGDDTTTMHGFSQGPCGAARYTGTHPGRLGSTAEPTVTINTRAAFNAMNGMFCGDDTTTMHGFSQGPRGALEPGVERGRAAAAVEPTVTVNTQAAFNAMNSMFAGDDTTTMHGFSQGPRGSARYAGGQHSRAAEPTVTINTRAAFDYMNDVFGDGQQAQARTGRQGGIPPGRSERRGGTSRLSMAAAAPLSLYEDTEFMGPRLTNANAPMALGLCEDTEFITRPVGGAAAAGAGAAGAGLGLCEDTEFITRPVGGAAAAAVRGAFEGSSNALGLCEDTEFITRPVGGAAAARGGLGGNSDALGLCEDTEFMTRPVGGAAAARGGLGGSSNALGLCEDTEFITRPVGGAAAAAGTGLSMYEDTEFVGGKFVSSGAAGGSLGLCEDTDFLTGSVGNPAAAAARPAAAAGFARHAHNSRPRLTEDCSDSTTGLLRVKENMPTNAAVGNTSQSGLRCPLGQSAAAAGSSRLGHSSAPSSPAHHYHQQQQQQQGPAWGAVTPGKPPMGPNGTASAASTPGQRHLGTPGAPWAQAMDGFEVMDSPAVRAALAERPALAMSPVASMPSPGLGACENDPEVAELHAHNCARRSMHDRAARAAALQPLSDARAEQLGVHTEPAAVPGGNGDEGAEGCTRVGTRPQGRALRSLKFQPDAGK